MNHRTQKLTATASRAPSRVKRLTCAHVLAKFEKSMNRIKVDDELQNQINFVVHNCWLRLGGNTYLLSSFNNNVVAMRQR